MRRIVFIAMCALSVLGCAFSAHAGDKANVLIVGLDADEQGVDTQTVVVGRDTRVFNRVLNTISSEVTQAGFNAFEERALTLASFDQRTEATLISTARALQRPAMDAVVFFTVYTSARRLAYTTDVYVRIAGRVVDVRTGEKVGGFEVTSPKGWRAPVNCERDCLVEAVGKNAMLLAVDLQDALAKQLGSVSAHNTAVAKAPLRATNAYTLIFTGFNPDDITGVEEYLTAFKGYKLYHPTATSSHTVQYAYEIDADSGQLTRNLRMMLDRLGAEGRVTFSAADKTFTVARAATPEKSTVATLGR